MKSILIFGCNGFVGRHLAEEFFNSGYHVIAAGHNECNNVLNKYVFAYHVVDLNDFGAVQEVIYKHRPSYIVNLAAVSSVAASWKLPQQTVAVNLIGSINILESIKKLNLNTKIMLIGSSEEYAVCDRKISEEYPIVANNPYGLSKVTQEHFSELYRNEYGLNIVNTRTFNHTGIGHSEKFVLPSFVRQVADIHKSGKPGIIKVGNLDAKRDFGHVKDMVRAYRMILESESKGTVYNVGSGDCHSVGELLEYIISLSDQEIKIEVDPEKLRPLDNPIIWCDNSKIKSEIGWIPQLTVFDAIDEMFSDMIRSKTEEENAENE